MEKLFYLLVISLSMLHQVLAHKANLCNVTESYFVEVTKTETVLEFKKPSGFHLLGMFSNSNKYENTTKTVSGVEKRERIIEDCCKGFKQKGDECVPINDEKSVSKPSTTSTTTTTTVAPTIAATEPAVKPTEPPSETPTTTSPITESKTTALSIEPSPTEYKAPEPPLTEAKAIEQVSTEIPPPEPISSEPPAPELQLAINTEQFSPSTEPPPVPPTEPKALESTSTEPKPAIVTEQSSPSTEPPPVPPTEPKAPEPTSTESKTSEPTSTESKPEPIIASTPPLTVAESTLPPQHPTNPEPVNELVTDPIVTDQTTIINGRRKRNINIPDSLPDTNTEQDEPDLKFNINDQLQSRKEYHEIVVNDIENENDNTTWIQVLELFSVGAVVFLLVITVQASYDGNAISSLWSSKNKNQIDSYGEFWIYDSQVSLEEV